MTDLTDKQQALLEELLKDFKGDARDILHHVLRHSHGNRCTLWRLGSGSAFGPVIGALVGAGVFSFVYFRCRNRC